MHSKAVPDKTPRKPEKKNPAKEPSPNSKPSMDFATTPSEPVKKNQRLKLRLKLGSNKPSSLKPSHKILQTPSAAAPCIHLQDLPHQQSQVTTRSKSKGKVKVTDSKFCVIHVDFFYHITDCFYNKLIKSNSKNLSSIFFY